MSETLAAIKRKISMAGELQGVVRTMKALAASNIAHYENSVRSLVDYDRTINLGLCVCFRSGERTPGGPEKPARDPQRSVTGAIIFGSDQGLVGQFNDIVADHAAEFLAALPGRKVVWAIGERIHARLDIAGFAPKGLFAVPDSVGAITQLVSQIQIEAELHREEGVYDEVYVFHNRMQSGLLYAPARRRLLPLDNAWRRSLAAQPWPSAMIPEVFGTTAEALTALIREHLFIVLFRACAESLACENATRLAAMQRADKNIDEMLGNLGAAFRRVRQSGIDAELFDVIAGFEALTKKITR